MKCKFHPYELGAGVCASCLRERLLALAAAQNALPATHDHRFYDEASVVHHPFWRRRPELQPLEEARPLGIPRSVSPYVGIRRSVGSDAAAGRLRRHERLQRFFSTPQVGPTSEGLRDGYVDGDEYRRRSSGKISVLRILFGHRRSEVADGPRYQAPKISRSRSWFSSLIHGHRKESRHFSTSAAAEIGYDASSSGKSRQPWRVPDRGISPANEDEEEEEEEDSGYSTDSLTGQRRAMPTPMRTFPASYRRRGSMASVSGFAVCLSPLLRAGPSGWRGQATDGGISGDGRASGNGSRHRKMPPGAAASLAPNRSLKLADLGRFK